MIAIVTDSSCYITRQKAKEYGVKIAPMSYTVGGQLFNETYPGENGKYVKLLEQYGNTAKTSQTPMSVFMSVFNELVRDGYEVLAITMSSRLSGTFSSAVAAAKTVDPDKITVVDSLSTAYGLYLLVEKAVELVRSGTLGLLDIARELDKVREKIGIVFSVDNLDALRRGGRLSIVRQSVSTILNVRPVLLCKDGVIISDGIAKGKTGLVRELVNRIPVNAKRIGVMHISTPEIEANIYEKLKITHPDAIVEKWDVGPVLAIHLGLYAIGIGWM